MDPFKPERSASFPWLKLVLMVIALAVVVWFIHQLGTVSTAPLIEATPDIELESPTPAGLEVELGGPPTPGEPAGEADAQPEAMERVRNTVTVVHDGDTVMLADGRNVRYLGIDAPERDEPFFHEATSVNRQMVQMKQVRLEVCKRRPKDKYQRTLASVYLPGQDEPVEIALLRQGLAEVFHDPDCIRDCRPGWRMLLGAFRQKKGMFVDADAEPVPAVLADRLIGRYGLVVGTVDHLEESTKAIHLNFGSDWTTDFTATINNRDLPEFLRDGVFPAQLLGKEMTLFGKVVSSYGPRIYLDCPAQIINFRAP